MSDENIRVEISASTGNLDQGMQQAAQSVQSGTASINNSFNGMSGTMSGIAQRFKALAQSITGAAASTTQATGSTASAVGQHAQAIGGAMNGAVSGIQGQLGGLSKAFGFISSNFAALAGVVAGVGVFKEGINATKEFTGEALMLSKALNISATEAATLNVALGDVYSSAETMVGASQHLSRQLRQNEDGLKAMGLRTREANGEYRNMKDLLLDGAKVLSGYKEGTDRALAGQVLFGKGAAEVGALMKLNNQVLEDAAQKQRDLGLVVSVENVEDMKAYKAAMNDVGDVMLALKKTIGDAVMPIFTKFGQWLASAGPATVFILKGAIDGLAAAFWYLKNGVVIVWETINALVVSVAEPIRALGASIYKALTGDWKGAAAEITGIGGVMAGAWKGAMAEMLKSSEETNAKVSQLFLPGTDTKATDNSKKKSFVDPGDGKDKKPKDERMKLWEATLLADKTAYMEQNDMREMSLQDEAAYWQRILGTLKAGDAQINAVKKKVAEANFADEKRIAKQRQDLQIEVIDFQQKMALGSVDAEQEAAAQRLAMGQQTQLQSIAQEQTFEDKRYDIQRKALQERLDMLSKDPTTNLVERQKILDQLLTMEQKHANDVAKIQNKAAQETAKPALALADGIGASFKQSLSGMLQGTTTFAGAIKGLFTGILGSFADMVSGMAADWLMAMIKNRIVQATTGVSQVMSNAAVAASAAFASTAAIPLIGPELAPGAAAAAYAATAAFAPMASARNGFDIPAGLNPVTQLHEREMVLPAKQADVIRNMADGGGGSGGGAINLHVHAVDAKSVQRLFKDNGRHLGAALQQQVRNFALKA